LTISMRHLVLMPDTFKDCAHCACRPPYDCRRGVIRARARASANAR
jgi:hypothetical protein